MGKGKIIGLTALGLAIVGTATYFAVPKITNKSWPDIINPPAQEETQTPSTDDTIGDTTTPETPETPGTETPGETDREDYHPTSVVFADVTYDDAKNILTVVSPNVDCDFRVQKLDGTGGNYEILAGETLEIDMSQYGVLATGEYDLLYYAISDAFGGIASDFSLVTINHTDTRAEYPVKFSVNEYGYLCVDEIETTIEAVNYEVYNSENVLVHSGTHSETGSNSENNRIFLDFLADGTYTVKLTIPESNQNLAFEQVIEVAWVNKDSLLDILDSALIPTFKVDDVQYQGTISAKRRPVNGTHYNAYFVFYPTEYAPLDEALGVYSTYDEEGNLSSTHTTNGQVSSMVYDEETETWNVTVDINPLTNEPNVMVEISFVSMDEYTITFTLTDGTQIVSQSPAQAIASEA